MFNKWLQWICLLSLHQCLFGQVESAVDTIYYKDTEKSKFLSHRFVIESTFNSPDSATLINPITGEIHYDFTEKKFIIVYYEYLKNGLPVSVYPNWDYLPYYPDSSSHVIPTDQKSKNESMTHQVYSSGSVYRQLSLNQQGGSEFTGGLQLQLNGQLSEDVYVSGILTDQDLPIQPEGVTQRLEELDKVMISISHPSVKVDAGDILYKDRNINRKLIGLKNSFNYGSWKGTTVFAGSKGQFHLIEMKGRDGDQGPYQLTGKQGQKDIVILAGTEKVWLNGNELTRGQKRDYTIDYSLGEVKFTPKHLIHSDSDILIEFEYADFQYQKGLIGGSLQKTNEQSKFTFGFYSEKDQYNSSNWSNKIIDSLKATTSSSIKILSATQDSSGDYWYVDGIFIYDSTYSQTLEPRYLVTFQSHPSGEYARRISDSGRIFYQYVGQQINEKNEIDLYSPYRTIQSPGRQQFGYLTSEFSLGKYVQVTSDLSMSLSEHNLMNPTIESISGLSHQFELKADSMQLGKTIISFALKDWNSESSFIPLERTYEPNQARFWNLDSIYQSGYKETSISGKVSIPGVGQSTLDVSQFSNASILKQRLHISQRLTTPFLNQSYVDYFDVTDKYQPFQRLDARVQLNRLMFAPFITVLNEHRVKESQFNQTGLGLQLNRERFQIEAGITKRENDSWGENDSYERIADDQIGFINISQRSNSGWANQILIQNRIKTGYGSEESTNYSLAHFDIGFNSIEHPLNLKLDFTLEESYSELRAVVYDSIGPGLGQYRYDMDFNDYVLDPNGAFISYTIPTGQREQTSEIHGLKTISFDLGKLNGFPTWLFRWNSRFDLKSIGDVNSFESQIHSYLNPNFTSFVQSRFELLSSGKNRFLGWIDSRHRLNGLDPRGSEINDYIGIGLHWDKYLTRSISLLIKSLHRFQEAESHISSIRNRSMEGQWHELKIQWKQKNRSDFSMGALGGWDTGSQQSNSFYATGLGMQFQLKHYFYKNALLQFESNVVIVNEKDNLSYLPPEALNGYSIGRSIRNHARFQHIVNQSLSLILTVQTIDDNRYNNYVNFQGEIRAHF